MDIFSLPALQESAVGKSIEKALHHAAEQNRGWVGVTESSAGTRWLEKGSLRHFPAFKVKTVGTLGAGDVFHGIFALGLAEGNTKENSVCWAAAAGATLSTHLGNGIAQMLPKTDNPILGQLAEDRFSASFIADGFHQQPHVLGVYLRAKQSIRTILVTDGTAGSASLPGSYSVGPIGIERQPEGMVYIHGTRILAGSSATLSGCLANVINWYGTPFDEAIRWASEQPRRLIGLPESLLVGEPKSQVVWKMETQKPVVERVHFGNLNLEHL